MSHTEGIHQQKLSKSIAPEPLSKRQYGHATAFQLARATGHALLKKLLYTPSLTDETVMEIPF